MLSLKTVHLKERKREVAKANNRVLFYWQHESHFDAILFENRFGFVRF